MYRELREGQCIWKAVIKELHYITKLRKRGGFTLSFLDKLRIKFPKRTIGRHRKALSRAVLRSGLHLKHCGYCVEYRLKGSKRGWG